MKKFITFVALVTLATGGLADDHAAAKKGCCGTCKKDAAVEQAKCCTKDGSCKKEAGACAKKAGACAKEAAEKAACSGGACAKTK